MTDNKLKNNYKPNVVYELLIHGVYHYAGCHCVNRNCLYTSGIINSSGNYLAEAMRKGLITLQEYRECVELVNVWEFDTRQDALDFETLKIQELKEKYGDLCKNKALYGNQHGIKGCSFTHSEEHRKKLSEACKGLNTWSRGKSFSEEHRKKLSEAHKGKSNGPHSEETKRKMSEAKKGKENCCKGKHYYTDGIINVRRFECPEGFVPGRKRTN